MYEMLDAIADAVNPTLLIIAMALPLFRAVRGRIRVERWYLCAAIGLALVYAAMYADGVLLLWGRIGADYSTHTAFALVLCMLVSSITRQFMVAASLLFLGYVALMLYQRYHTLLDVVTTVIAVAAVFAMTLHFLKPRAR